MVINLKHGLQGYIIDFKCTTYMTKLWSAKVFAN